MVPSNDKWRDDERGKVGKRQMGKTLLRRKQTGRRQEAISKTVRKKGRLEGRGGGGGLIFQKGRRRKSEKGRKGVGGEVRGGEQRTGKPPKGWGMNYSSPPGYSSRWNQKKASVPKGEGTV